MIARKRLSAHLVDFSKETDCLEEQKMSVVSPLSGNSS